MERTIPRILVLGSGDHTPLVTSYDWDSLPDRLNIADFDVLVLNLVPFSTPANAESIEIEKLPTYEQFVRFLFSPNSRLIVFGNPRHDLGKNGELSPTWFLPKKPIFEFETGESMELIDQNFGFYLPQVKEWECWIRGWVQEKPLDMGGLKGVNKITVDFSPIAINRFNRAIAFSTWFVLHGTDGHKATSGEVTWLPEATEISQADAIDLILEEMFWVSEDAPPPEWSKDYHLPQERILLDTIHEHETAIQKLYESLDISREALQKVLKASRILYEADQMKLNQYVRETFYVLGAELLPPMENGKEAFRVKLEQGLEATVDVKVFMDTLEIEPILALDRYVRDSLATEGRESKGVLVINLQPDLAPHDRNSLLPREAVIAAKKTHICLITTTQLFNILIMRQEGRVAPEQFWQVIFQTSGLTEIPELAS